MGLGDRHGTGSYTDPPNTDTRPTCHTTSTPGPLFPVPTDGRDGWYRNNDDAKRTYAQRSMTADLSYRSSRTSPDHHPTLLLIVSVSYRTTPTPRKQLL